MHAKCTVVHAQFVDGAFEGLGAETFQEGLYVGSFRNGQRHGLGELLFSTTALLQRHPQTLVTRLFSGAFLATWLQGGPSGT